LASIPSPFFSFFLFLPSLSLTTTSVCYVHYVVASAAFAQELSARRSSPLSPPAKRFVEQKQRLAKAKKGNATVFKEVDITSISAHSLHAHYIMTNVFDIGNCSERHSQTCCC
jgi:hypothetical protein